MDSIFIIYSRSSTKSQRGDSVTRSINGRFIDGHYNAMPVVPILRYNAYHSAIVFSEQSITTLTKLAIPYDHVVREGNI